MRNIFHTFRRLAADLRLSLCALNRIQFSAPWKSPSRCG
jgi:hypothetical protein